MYVMHVCMYVCMYVYMTQPSRRVDARKQLPNEYTRYRFRYCTSKTKFLFDGKVYDQIDGIDMRSPTLENLFMGHHEKQWIEESQGERPIFYKRHVDDIFSALTIENKL